MRYLFLFALLTACGSSTDPHLAGDPSLLITNNLSGPVYLTWQDGNAIVGQDVIPAHTTNHCSRFLAQPDSAYFQIVATEDLGGHAVTTTITAPWFNPATRPAWTIDIDYNPSGSPIVVVRDSEIAC